MKEIAYISLTPLGDVICCINQLEHLKKIYVPCRITVFAIPLIAELMKNSVWADEVIPLKGGVHGDLDLTDFVPPATEFDAVFNLAYYPVYLELQKKLKCKVRYGSECRLITQKMYKEIFDKWFSLEYRNNVTLKKYRTVCEQMAKPIRLVNPEYHCTAISLFENTCCRSVTFCFTDTHFIWALYANDQHTVIHTPCADYESCRDCCGKNCARYFEYDRIYTKICQQLEYNFS